MWGHSVFLVLFALTAFGTAECPQKETSPIKEILCYTSTLDTQFLVSSICSCTTLVHQNHDIQNFSISDISHLRNFLKEMHPSLQFVISIYDPAMTLRNSAMVRQEAIARIITIMKEVDGIEMNITAGSKERLYNFVKSLKNEMIRKSYDKRLFMVLPSRSEDLAKQFDIKELIKYIDLFTLPTDYMTDENGAFVTFHPSRLIGLFDMLNTDSLVDLISGLGVPKQKILMTLPAKAYKFALKNEDENAPRSETTEKEPVPIDRKQLCEALNSGEWTVERDEDLTAPYAFQNKTWIAFEDKISVGIKGKYSLLRDLAGLAVRNIEDDVETKCEESLTQEIHRSFTEFKRKSRQAVLNALEDELHQMQFSYPNHAKTSNFRIVRVVDTEGHIRAVRESTQTEFVCRQQGYFVHPKSCNRFYRCVKFNQAVEDYSVFEFDCPAGLSFDERTEVCVWPGSLPEGSPCPGSSEIAPVAPKRFKCSQPGYYADPQNCRWFFACMDLGEPELMAFEFRCPYGLVFDEKKLVCEWPWLVPTCSASGSSYTRTEYNYGGYTAGTSTAGGISGYVNGGLPGYSGATGSDYIRTTNIGTGIYGSNNFGSTTREDIKRPGISISGGGISGFTSADYSKSTGYRSEVSSVPTYHESSNVQIGSVPSSIIAGASSTEYSALNNKIGNREYTVFTNQDGTEYSAPNGFNTGFINTGSLGGFTAGFSGSTIGEYSQTTDRSHLTKQDVTSSQKFSSSYPGLIGGNYKGSTSSPIIDSYTRTPERIGSSIHTRPNSPKYAGSTNVPTSGTFNANSYSTSTGIYSGATGHQLSVSPSFGSVSYHGAIGNIDITGLTKKGYTKSTEAEYSKTVSGINTSSTESNIKQSSNSGIEPSIYSTTGSGRVPDFISNVPRSELETSGISSIPGHVSITSRPLSASSPGYKFNKDEGYTIPVFIQHEQPIYTSIGTIESARGHASTETNRIDFTSGYEKTDFKRPNLNISIFGNKIPISYGIQKDSISTIQTGSSVDGSITTGDSFSRNIYNHGNIPGTVSTPVINQGAILTGGIQPGYISTSSGTPGYAINDGIKPTNFGSAGTLIYGTPSSAISINGPSTAGIILKDDSTSDIVVSGQTAPATSLGGSIQSGSTIKSSTHKTYESQSAYHNIPDSIIYTSSTPREGLISTTPHGYKIDEKHNTITFNATYDINKYAGNDIPDYRPTSSIFPDTFVSGGRIENDSGYVHSSIFQGSTTPGYSPSKSVVFTPSGFTKTGPTRTGITTAILGGGGRFSVSTSDRPTYNPDNIGEKAFEGNVGYTKTSSVDNLSINLTPPDYSSIASPNVRVSTPSGYSYPKPNIQFRPNSATFSSTSSVGSNLPVTTSKPFFNRLPTSTVTPIIYTSEYPEIYKTTLFEPKKIPTSTDRPIDINYKTLISSTTSIPVSLTNNRFTQQGNSQTASSFNFGSSLQQTQSNGQTNYISSLGYSSAKSTEPDVIVPTTKYGIPTTTTRPEIGVTYKKPLSASDISYGGPSSFQLPTTFRPSSSYYAGQKFSTTPSSINITPDGGSPTNLDISRDKIDKLITNYDRGTIKYTPTVYDTYSSLYTSSEYDSNKKFTSLSSTKSSFSTKTGSDVVVTTPSGIRPSTLSYEVTTKLPEDKGKVIVKWSDLHPLLLGKLGAECTCKADPFANLRGPGKKQLIESSKGKVDLSNYDSSEIYVDIGSSGEDYSNYDNSPKQPFKISAPIPPNLPASSYLPVADTRAQNNQFRSGRRMGKKLEYEEDEEETNEEYENDDPDQIINGVTDCARPGLFRHPGLCNKFYACHWDQWKKKFTLHIFNCPIHLTFDSSAGACNWPSKGPACQADNLLV